MGRQSGNKKFASSSTPAPSDLLNFHLPTRPTAQHANSAPARRNNSNNNNRSDYGRSSGARRKASTSTNMFYLHSSPNHSFILKRKSKQGYSFSGPDTSVSWEDVRAVKYLVPSIDATQDSSEETCPICLDVFTCVRITKCGHCFCLPCLLRHIHTCTATNPSAGVKCPCCALPVFVDDIRPVLVESVRTPKVQTRLKMVKLHRTKDCPAPYLPQRGQWKRSSPHTAPTMTDKDGIFSRFLYMDPIYQHGLLSANVTELEQYARPLRQNDMEVLFVQMALERVSNELNRAVVEIEGEEAQIDEFSQPHVGMYQPIHESLFARQQQQLTDFASLSIETVPSDDISESYGSRKESVGSETEALTTRVRGESMGSDMDHSHRGRPNRGYSIDSQESGHGQDAAKQRRERKLPVLSASMYLEDHASLFYQSADGQLYFLSKFNMNCLTEEFTVHIPQEMPSDDLPHNSRRKFNPLPDFVEGNILEIEPLHLTPELRKRMPFLSHLPTYMDISFVELDLNRILSYETKKKFRNEFEKRKRRRKNKAIAEKKVDRKMQRKEEDRINELKSRIQFIDPSDQFFRLPPDPEPGSLVGDQFGPSISGSIALPVPQQQAALNFSAVVHTPSSVAMTEDAFPTLGSSPTTQQPSTQPSWGTGWHAANAPQPKSITEQVSPSPAQSSGPSKKGKKSKNKGKVLLFSTGGQRGGF